MKNGLINESGKLIYYKDGQPVHAGAIEYGGSIYYIGKDGIAATGKHIVHHQMANGLLKRGTYTFGEDGKLIEGSYIPPEKSNGTNRKKRKLKRRIKWLKNKIGVFIMILAFLLAATAIVLDNIDISAGDNNNQGITLPSDEFVLPTFAEKVRLCSKEAYNLYYGEITVAEAVRYGSPYKSFVFEYDLKGNDGLLMLSENSDMSNPIKMPMSKDKNALFIDNLKTNTKYFYTVIVNEKKYNGYFETARSTRFISIDGIYNTRDIGGYTNLEGKSVKQGMIIRGTELDGLVEPQYRLSYEGKETIKKLGFAYDMDLRASNLFFGTYTSPLGSDVGHKFYTAPQYGQIFSSSYKESLRLIFSDMANPENYPMYLHCTYGADRTGTIVFLLQGILNMPEDQMIREYQMTGFFLNSYANSENMDIVISGLQNKEGDTLQEKIVNFLIGEIGVLPEEIESIRNILLEG